MKPTYSWKFYKDTAGEYRWTKKCNDNGEVVGAAHEGFASMQIARDNARINGWEG